MPAACPRQSPHQPCSTIRRSRSPSPKGCPQGSKLWQAYLQKGQALYNQGLDGTPDSLGRNIKYDLAQNSGQLAAAAIHFPHTASHRAASSGADHRPENLCPKSTAQGLTARSQGLDLSSSANEEQAGPSAHVSHWHSAFMEQVPHIPWDNTLWDLPGRQHQSKQNQEPGALSTVGDTDQSGDVTEGSSSSSSCAG